jgi:hypothetical protein
VLPELLAGMLAGSLHALGGPDHVAALAPLAVAQRRSALGIGVRWGVGHGVGIALVGVLALALREALPLESVAVLRSVEGWGERIVGAVLIAIGLACVYRALRTRVHAHVHAHDGVEHVHVHAHRGSIEHHVSEIRHLHPHTSLAIGILHGVAGGPHLIALLPLLALPGHWGASAYLGGFTLGAVLAMGLMASALGALSGLALRGGRSVYRCALGSAGALSVAVGGFWIVS